MTNPSSVTLSETFEAFLSLDGRYLPVKMEEVKQWLLIKRGGIPFNYQDLRSFHNTIQALVQNHCAEAATYKGAEVYFGKVRYGYYMLCI